MKLDENQQKSYEYTQFFELILNIVLLNDRALIVSHEKARKVPKWHEIRHIEQYALSRLDRTNFFSVISLCNFVAL